MRICLPDRTVLALVLATLLTGCGQKGALYLPITTKSVVAPLVSDQLADINGVSLRYQLSGMGSRSIVLLHAAGMTLESWDDVMPMLNTSHRVLRYDLRGSGRSAKIDGAVTLDDAVADLRGLLDRVGFNQPVTLVGGAVGAAIALRFASTYPEHANAVLALSPVIDVAESQTAWPRIRCPVWIVAARPDQAQSVESMQAIADAIPAGMGHVELLDSAQPKAIQSPELPRPLLQKFLSAVEH
jgi:pimeloyl-ACP methyl ester carboxylesterase